MLKLKLNLPPLQSDIITSTRKRGNRSKSEKENKRGARWLAWVVGRTRKHKEEREAHFGRQESLLVVTLVRGHHDVEAVELVRPVGEGYLDLLGQVQLRDVCFRGGAPQTERKRRMSEVGVSKQGALVGQKTFFGGKREGKLAANASSPFCKRSSLADAFFTPCFAFSAFSLLSRSCFSCRSGRGRKESEPRRCARVEGSGPRPRKPAARVVTPSLRFGAQSSFHSRQARASAARFSLFSLSLSRERLP